MLEAFTGAAPDVSIVTGTGCSLAAWEKIAAGRAWRPLELATVTVRAGISNAFLDVVPHRVAPRGARRRTDRDRRESLQASRKSWRMSSLRTTVVAVRQGWRADRRPELSGTLRPRRGSRIRTSPAAWSSRCPARSPRGPRR